MTHPTRLAPSLLALTAAVACALSSSPARANGRFPTAQHVVVGPGAESTVIALRTTFGLLLSRDAGRTFSWLCEEGMYFPLVPSTNFDPPIEVAATGSVVIGYEDGIRHSADACKADDARNTAHHVFADLTADPTGRILYAIEGAQGVANAVYRGDGNDYTFTRQGEGLFRVLFDTIEVAPSNPSRLYLTGRDTDTFAPIFYRSDDSGVTLTPIASDAGAADSLWVSGVDPTQPDTVYVRAAMGLGTELRRSTDGGRSFRTIATTRDPMLGFAMSDDGRTLWVGSIDAGLLRSDDGGESFRQVNRIPVLCLRQHANTLWACSDWINTPFALGRSSDGGASFTPVVTFSNFTTFTGPPVCEMRSEGAAICVERWPMLQRSLQVPDPDAGRPPPLPDAGRRDASADVADARADVAFDVVRDATVTTPPPPPASECGCRTPGSTAAPRALLSTLAALCVSVFARRRVRNRVASAIV
jgi:hypothetical protein